MHTTLRLIIPERITAPSETPLALPRRTLRLSPRALTVITRCNTGVTRMDDAPLDAARSFAISDGAHQIDKKGPRDAEDMGPGGVEGS